MNKDERFHSTGFDDLRYDYFNHPERVKKASFFKRLLMKIRGH